MTSPCSSLHARYSVSDLTPLQPSVLFQDINFHVAVIFNSSADGAQMEGVGERTRPGEKLKKASASQNGSG